MNLEILKKKIAFDLAVLSRYIEGLNSSNTYHQFLFFLFQLLSMYNFFYPHLCGFFL